jgi:hypothetical protein
MKSISTVFLILILAIFLINGNSMATSITVDGIFDLTEWDGYYADDDGVLNTSGYVEPGWGGQLFDVEYLGLYITSEQVYFGLQTGFDVSADMVSTYRPGDFALDVDGDEMYDYAIRFSFIDGVFQGFSLYNVTSWSVPVFAISTPFEMAVGGGTMIDPAAFTGAFGSGEYANNRDGGTSYVLEGSFDLALLTAYTGNDIGIHWTMECGNDVLNQNSAPVPEPATMLLFGCGLIGLAAVGKKKFQQGNTK